MRAAKRPRVFFDADVLVAGSASRSGASFLLLQLAELGVIEGITCQQAIGEVERNLMAKLPAALPAFRAIISAAVRVTPDPAPQTLRRMRGQAHQEDLPILASAAENACDHLVTFNVRHYRPAASGPRVLRPGDMVQVLRDLGSGEGVG